LRFAVHLRAISTAVRILVIAFAMLACGHAAPAWAHASLVSTNPADGTVVAAAPSQLTLAFSEPVAPIVLRLIGPDGTSTPLERYQLKDKTLVIEAPAMERGTHVISWRVTSEDGHPVGGSVVFSVGAPGGQASAGSSETPWSAKIAIWAAKVALYAGLFFGIGGIAYASLVANLPVGIARTVGSLIVLGIVAAIASAGLQGMDALGAPLSSLARAETWRAGFETSYGRTSVIAFLVLGIGLACMKIRSSILHKSLAIVALAGVGASLAASGHASSAQPQWLMRPAVFAHGIGIAFWAGSLLPLAFHLRAGGTDAVHALTRFSRLIPTFVASLVLAGIVLAVVQVETVSALWQTAYGQVLTIKLALLVLLFGLAVINRFRLTVPAERGDAKAARTMGRIIIVETLLIVAILGVAAAWRFTPPPRSLAVAASGPVSLHVHGDKAMADLTVTPGRPGPVEASISVMTGDMGPLDPKEVSITLANPNAGIEPIERKAIRQSDGAWRIENLTIPAAGQWKAEITILISDFELVRLEGTLEIKP
jgi:copper transport protein